VQSKGSWCARGAFSQAAPIPARWSRERSAHAAGGVSLAPAVVRHPVDVLGVNQAVAGRRRGETARATSRPGIGASFSALSGGSITYMVLPLSPRRGSAATRAPASPKGHSLDSSALERRRSRNLAPFFLLTGATQAV
jgi:hypothetical protein